MIKCKCCNKNEGIYPHFNGGKVCDECLGNYFVCPKCSDGTVYDMDDYVNGDSGDGFCRKHKMLD